MILLIHIHKSEQMRLKFDQTYFVLLAGCSTMAETDRLYFLRYHRADVHTCLPQGVLGDSAPSLSERAPVRWPVSRGQTCGLMVCLKHSDILQTPVLKRCHTLAVIVMGGSGQLNKQAGDLYHASPSM